MVELMGIEPTTPCLQSRCSSQLSYSPVSSPGDTTQRRAMGHDGGMSNTGHGNPAGPVA